MSPKTKRHSTLSLRLATAALLVLTPLLAWKPAPVIASYPGDNGLIVFSSSFGAPSGIGLVLASPDGSAG